MTTTTPSEGRRVVMRGLETVALDKNDARGKPLNMLHGEYVPTLDDHRYVSGMIAMHVLNWRAQDDEDARVVRWVENTPRATPTQYVCQERVGVAAEVWLPTDNLAQVWMAIEYFALVLGIEFQYTSSGFYFQLVDDSTHAAYMLFGMQKVRGPVHAAFELACALVVAFEFATETRVAAGDAGLVFNVDLFSKQCPEYIGHSARFGTLSPILPPI